MKIKYSALNITTVTVNKIFNLFYKNEMIADLMVGKKVPGKKYPEKSHGGKLVLGVKSLFSKDNI